MSTVNKGCASIASLTFLRLTPIGSWPVQPSGRHTDGHDRVVAWAFVLVQLALLAAVFQLPDGSDWTTPAWLSKGADLLLLLGLVVLAIGLVNLGRSATALPTPVSHGRLHSNGLYRYIRHPIYGGMMALAIGSAVPSGSIGIAAAASALVVWLAIKAAWEERLLSARYPGYSEYAARTPRFVPSFRRRPPG
jgi:protein-S-isoprenylcysteine O-methyltransferase Ste14